ncbi:MAG: ATP-binding cassette domain-containing protein [Blautia sp.]|nr:ATP-binding cassette domain-containing protein [Blautia sp.]
MHLYVDIKKKAGSFVLQAKFETEGPVLGILGESGCGKSMTLRCIAGVDTPDEGIIRLGDQVFFDSQRRINRRPQERHVGFLFQNYALFPNMTVRQNIYMGIRRFRKEKAKAYERVDKIIQDFYLTGLENHYPDQLSGGQQQRTALARILISEPELLMLDEPFSALDEFLRWKLELELKSILDNYHNPVLFVSHDRGEIYRICDEVAAMQQGCTGDTLPVKEMFYHPASKAQAYISGCKNISEAEVRSDEEVYAKDWGISLKCSTKNCEGVHFVGVRSHFIFPVLYEETGLDSRAVGRITYVKCILDTIVEDVFGMIVMIKIGPGAKASVRMEISKTVWEAYCRSAYGKIPVSMTEYKGKPITVGIRGEDVMLLN